ncbi:MAG: globin domain-containing protein [Planctomycetaceae bacterium]
MSKPELKEILLASLIRCASQPNFVPSFYNRFMGSSPEIPPYFKKTDFKKQNEMLLHSLNLSTGAVSGEPAALRELKERAESHDRYHLDVKPHLYDFWLNALIETVRDFDDKWNPTIEEAWRTTFQHVIDYMRRRH